MGFCEFSNEKIVKNNIELSNYFITEYMNNANELQIKIYLYGLYLCQNANIPDNALEEIAKKFNINDKNDVLATFVYWEDLGLVKIINIGDEYKIKFLPISKYGKIEKDVKSGKYSKFCNNVQEFITGRQILPNEFYEYIDFLDYSHMEPNALLAIVNYAVTLKGDNVAYKYILAIAKAWQYKGILTEKAVLNEIEESNAYNEDLIMVLKELGKTKAPSFDEKQDWQLFTKNWNFDFNLIIYIAKMLKKKKNHSFSSLKEKLEKYYKLNIHTINEVDEYETAFTTYFDTAKLVTQELGLYYENLNPIVDNYVISWYNHGFDFDTLKKVASYCFKNNVRTLEGMNKTIEKFVKLGLITIDAINEYINELINVDKQIKVILEKLCISRNVNSYDRDFYKIWTSKYNFSEEILEHAIEKAIGKFQPMQYLNKILASYYQNNVKTIEDAKLLDNKFTSNNVIGDFGSLDNKAKSTNTIITHSYTDEELNSLFTNLDEIDI